MRITILFYFFYLFCNQGWSQQKTDIDNISLKGNIKSMNSFKFKYFGNNKKTSKKPLMDKIFYFNNKGFLTEEIENHKKNKPSIIYSYDNDNNLIEIFQKNKKRSIRKTHYSYENGKKKECLIEFYYPNNPKPTFDTLKYYYYEDNLVSLKMKKRQIKYKYNLKGKKTEVVYLNKKNQTFKKDTYKYNDNNVLIYKKVITSIEYDDIGSHYGDIKSKKFNSNKKEYKLDSLNHVIEKNQFYNDKKLFKIINSYNKSNNLNSTIYYDEKDSVFCKKTFHYDSINRLSEIKFPINNKYKSYNISSNVKKITYKYDLNNNWIEKIFYYKYQSETEIQREVYKRDIIYYK